MATQVPTETQVVTAFSTAIQLYEEAKESGLLGDVEHLFEGAAKELYGAFEKLLPHLKKKPKAEKATITDTVGSTMPIPPLKVAPPLVVPTLTGDPRIVPPVS